MAETDYQASYQLPPIEHTFTPEPYVPSDPKQRSTSTFLLRRMQTEAAIASR